MEEELKDEESLEEDSEEDLEEQVDGNEKRRQIICKKQA